MARLGFRQSATWRSIFKARSKGLRFRVGNGNNISMLQDPWIPDAGLFRSITPKPTSPSPEKVADLIDPLTNSWNVVLMEYVMWRVDIENILTIPIGALDVEDRLI